VIVVICGPPGAGKTTVATRVRRRLEERIVRFVSFTPTTSRVGPTSKLAERVDEAPADAITLVDGTFYRREWQTRFRTLGTVRFVLVTASLETCLERNRERADAIDEQGVHVVFREFEEPDPPTSRSIPSGADQTKLSIW